MSRKLGNLETMNTGGVATKKIVIVGAGGFGREVYTWLLQTIQEKPELSIGGFLDDNIEENQREIDKRNYQTKIIGTTQDYQPGEDELFVMGIFDPAVKKQCAESLRQRGAQFYTLVHPLTVVGHDVSVGEGCVICPNCILANDSEIGDFVTINTNSTVGHDTQVGEYTSINGGVEITGEIEVGSECFFGVGAVVINGCRIGSQAVVGAGSVVIRNVGRGVTVFGNPAKQVKGI